jgi:hypothetical protein
MQFSDEDASFLDGGIHLTEEGFTATKPKAIKVDKAKADDIAAALKAANGRATAHTFTEFGEISRRADGAEKALDALGIPKADRAGARYVAQSGSTLPNAYKFKTTATVVTLLRRPSAWYLESASTYDLYPKSTPGARLELTPEQDAIAVAYLRRGYTIRKPKG